MKKKLIASIFSLVMAFVLMTSSSFAWFVMSESAEANGMNVTMEAYDNIEIAAGEIGDTISEVAAGDADKWNTWGAYIKYNAEGVKLDDMATVDGEDEDGLPLIKCATYNGEGETPNSNDGRMDEIVAATKVAGDPDYSTENALEPFVYTSGRGECAVRYGMWVRSNTYETVVATPDLETVADAEDLDVYINGELYEGDPIEIAIDLEENKGTYVDVVVLLEGTTHHAIDLTSKYAFKGSIAFTAPAGE